jgi:hypothetical protein
LNRRDGAARWQRLAAISTDGMQAEGLRSMFPRIRQTFCSKQRQSFKARKNENLLSWYALSQMNILLLMND